MTLDHDGKIRMDCSSPVRDGEPGRAARTSIDLAFGNDTDADRHGIVTPSGGPAEPEPLPGGGDRLPFAHRPSWPRARGGRQDAGQQQPDRSRGAKPRAARCVEVPVGFKWFVDGPARRLARVRRRGERRRVLPAPRRHASGPPTRTASSWTCSRRRSRARTGKDPGEHYRELADRVRRAARTRASTSRRRRRRRRRSKKLSPDAVHGDDAGGRADHCAS